MQDIRITEWLNSNCARSFPLVVSGDLAQDVLVDCRLCFFKEQPAEVYLSAVSLSSGTATVVVSVNGRQYSTSAVVISSSLYSRVYVDTVHGNLSFTLGPGLATLTSWTGSLQVEPACTMFPRRVDHIGATDDIPIDPANPHTVMEGDYAQAHSGSALSRPYAVAGAVKLEGGYGIQVEVSGQTVTLSAVPGYGDLPGYPCFKVHGSSTQCFDKVFRVNGVSPDSFGKMDVLAGSGMRIGVDGSGNLLVRADLSSTQPGCRKA